MLILSSLFPQLFMSQILYTTAEKAIFSWQISQLIALLGYLDSWDSIHLPMQASCTEDMEPLQLQGSIRFTSSSKQIRHIWPWGS